MESKLEEHIYTLYIIKLIRQTNTNRNNFYTLVEGGSDNKTDTYSTNINNLKTQMLNNRDTLIPYLLTLGKLDRWVSQIKRNFFFL